MSHSTGDVLCRYYAQGACNKGAACAFSHDRNARPNNVCRFYLKGQCSYGDRCRYDHVRPKTEQRQPASRAAAASSAHRGISSTGASSLPMSTSAPLASTSAKRRPGPRPVTLADLDAATASPSAAQISSNVGGVATSQQTRNTTSQTHTQSAASIMSWGAGPTAAEHPPPWLSDPWESFEHTSDSDHDGFDMTAIQSTMSALFSQPEGDDGHGPSYASTARIGADPAASEVKLVGDEFFDDDETIEQLCPYAMAMGECPYGEDVCTYVHGERCPCCMLPVLHPDYPDTHNDHIDKCVALMENMIEETDRMQQSMDVECGICMEKVYDNPNPSDRRFGLLPNCDHPFCLKCIRGWRSTSSLGSQVRTCPLCREVSYFIVPSQVFVTSGEAKTEIIEEYKAKLKTIDCKHFRKGEGTCPFGSSCFYRHADKHGREVVPEAPRYRGTADGDIERMGNIRLADFLFDTE